MPGIFTDSLSEDTTESQLRQAPVGDFNLRAELYGVQEVFKWLIISVHGPCGRPQLERKHRKELRKKSEKLKETQKLNEATGEVMKVNHPQ